MAHGSGSGSGRAEDYYSAEGGDFDGDGDGDGDDGSLDQLVSEQRQARQADTCKRAR